MLQSYLDAELDERAARRVGPHLERCRRCRLEAATYLEIRRCLERRARPLPEDSLERLRTFANRLAGGPERRRRSSPT